MSTRVAARADPAECVRTFFDAAAEALAETGYLDLCPIGTIAAEVASSDEALRAACEQVFATWTAAIARRLTAAGTPPDDAQHLARTVVATLEGSFVLSRTRRDATALRMAGRHMHDLLTGAMMQVPSSHDGTTTRGAS